MPFKLAARLGEKNDANSMAIKHWTTIRKKITTQNEGTSSLHDINESVTHGIYKTINLPSEKEIKSVTHNLHSGQYLILHEDGKIDIFLKDGSKEKASPTEPLSGIVYASKPMLYATWNSQNIMKVCFKCRNMGPGEFCGCYRCTENLPNTKSVESILAF